MNKIRKMCESIADEIRRKKDADKWLSNSCQLAVLVEDKLTDNFAIESSLGRNSLAVVVGLTSFARKAQMGELAFGTATFDISVFENPTMNRESEGTPTAQSVAEFLIDALHWATLQEFETPLRFQSMTRADEPQAVVERLTFVADVQI